MATPAARTRTPVKTGTIGNRKVSDEITDFIRNGKGQESFARFAGEMASIANGGATQDRLIALNYTIGMLFDSDVLRRGRAEQLFNEAGRRVPPQYRARFDQITTPIIMRNRNALQPPQVQQMQRR